MPQITSNTQFTLAKGAVAIFELGGSGSAIVDPAGRGNRYTIGNQQAFLGPYDRALQVAVEVANGPITYVVDQDGDLADQADPIARINERVDGASKASPIPAICFLGDSITRDSFSSDATKTQFTQWGWVTHFRRMVRGRATVDGQNIYAVASMGVTHLNSIQVPQAIASGCKIACIKIGTNDVGSVDIVSGLEQAYSKLLAAGITIIASPILPHSSPSSFNTAQRAIVDRVNQYIADVAATTRGIVYAPTLTYVTDFSTGDAKSGMLRDGIHTTPAGAYMVARGFFDAADKILPASVRPILVASSSYDATMNPYGDILQNGMMIGTSGTLRNGATGSVPSNWFGQRSSGGSTVTTALSKEVDSATGINKAVITIGGTGDGSYVGYETNGLTIPSGIAAGDVIEVEAFAEWSGLSNCLGVYGRIRATDGTTATEAFDGIYNGGNGNIDAAGDGSGWLSLMYVVPRNVTAPYVQLQVATKSGVTVAGVVKFSQASLRKVRS